MSNIQAMRDTYRQLRVLGLLNSNVTFRDWVATMPKGK